MITLDRVSAAYGRDEVLHQVSVNVPSGTVCALIGPNGCGKSTLLKTMAALLRPTQGEVCLDGIALRDIARGELARRIAYLPQSRLVSDMTVEQLVMHGRYPYLSYPRRYRSEDIQAAQDAMEWIGIGNLSQRNLNQLSGGERQKAFLAMALAQGTDHMLLDEPTTYLDVAHQLELMELIQRLKDEGKTVILVLHDLNLALRYAQQIALMERGRILITGTPDELYCSGQLEQVFRVRLGRSVTECSGTQYYYF